jgi:hypothetical protein
MKREISGYIGSCDTYQRIKASRHKPYELLQPLPFTNNWEGITMDFFTGLLLHHNYDDVMVVKCLPSKLCHFIPVSKSITSEEVATSFVKYMYI